MREIVIDTETTGLDPNDGHRIVEIACIELMHHVPTGRKFHRYVNPGRDIPADALAVHGLTAEFLANHPRRRVSAADDQPGRFRGAVAPQFGRRAGPQRRYRVIVPLRYRPATAAP